MRDASSHALGCPHPGRLARPREWTKSRDRVCAFAGLVFSRSTAGYQRQLAHHATPNMNPGVWGNRELKEGEGLRAGMNSLVHCGGSRLCPDGRRETDGSPEGRLVLAGLKPGRGAGRRLQWGLTHTTQRSAHSLSSCPPGGSSLFSLLASEASIQSYVWW